MYGGDSSQTRRVNPIDSPYLLFHWQRQRALFVAATQSIVRFALFCAHSTLTNKYIDSLSRPGLDFPGYGDCVKFHPIYGVEKLPNPETLADSRGILGNFREFDESNGTRPLPAFNASNFIDSRNITIRCYISIMELCITVFWYKCVILWDICFIISLLKC